MTDSVDREMLVDFAQETKGYVPRILRAIDRASEEVIDREALDEARRLIHTVKGAAAMIGLRDLSSIARVVEEALEDVSAGSLSPTPALKARLRKINFLIGYYLDALLSNDSAGEILLQELQAEARLVGGGGALDAPVSSEMAPRVTQEETLASPLAAEKEGIIEIESPSTADSADGDLLDIFAVEAQELLVSLSKSIAAVQNDRADIATLTTARDVARTMKGSASMIGIQPIVRLSQMMQERLDEIIAAERPISEDQLLLLRGSERALEDRLYGRLREDQFASITEELAAAYAMPFEAGEGDDASGASAATDTGEAGDEIDPELLEIFAVEANEHIHNAAEQLGALSTDPSNYEALNAARNVIHTFKGASGVIGMRSMAALCGKMEDLLDRAIENRSALRPDDLGFLSRALELLENRIYGRLSDVRFLSASEEVGVRLEEAAARLPVRSRPYGSSGEIPADRDAAGETGPGSASSEMADVDPELLEVFALEAEDHLRSISSLLADISRNAGNHSLLLEARRVVHTLKGAAGVVGLRTISQLAHRMEDLFERLNEAGELVSPEQLSLLFGACDVLEGLIYGRSVDKEYEEVIGRFAATLAAVPRRADTSPAVSTTLSRPQAQAVSAPSPSEPEAETSGALAAPVAAAPPIQEKAEPRDSALLLRLPITRVDDVVKLVSELVINRSTFDQRMQEVTRQVDDLHTSVARLKRALGSIEKTYEIRALSQAPAVTGTRAPNGVSSPGRSADHFDELEMDRYTELHSVARELSETTSDIDTVASELDYSRAEFSGALDRQRSLTSEIQEKLMRLRMVPLDSIEARLDRAVRTTAEQRGKAADFVMDGTETEIDKAVLEAITDPLMHLLRNSVDHGLESPASRVAVGKPKRGTIRVGATHDGAQVVIRIHDDGAGLDLEKIRVTAVRHGLMSEAEAAEMRPSDLHELIFAPGFSTAKEVSEVSGRGVGMDIVKSTVERLRGSVAVESIPGRGTTVTIRLPLTLALARVLIVRLGHQHFAVPLAALENVLRVETSRIESIGDEDFIRMDDATLPVIHLREHFNLAAGDQEAQTATTPILVVRVGEKKMAVVVDALVERREVVMKTLGTYLRRVHGVAGATLMGDGSVVLILNPNELARSAVVRQAPGTVQLGQSAAAPRVALDILLVDDSLSVRKVLSNFVQRSGWNPIVAKDGVEALEILQRIEAPDLILTDIEMPRMDGFELTSSLRSQERFRNIPIVIITSRAGDKHRQKAMELGATDYLVKPYQDDALHSMIRSLTGRSRSRPA